MTVSQSDCEAAEAFACNKGYDSTELREELDERSHCGHADNDRGCPDSKHARSKPGYKRYTSC
jgi:hypothetical protein